VCHSTTQQTSIGMLHGLAGPCNKQVSMHGITIQPRTDLSTRCHYDHYPWSLRFAMQHSEDWRSHQYHDNPRLEVTAVEVLGHLEDQWDIPQTPGRMMKSIITMEDVTSARKFQKKGHRRMQRNYHSASENPRFARGFIIEAGESHQPSQRSPIMNNISTQY
jgi:hypothetical protein